VILSESMQRREGQTRQTGSETFVSDPFFPHAHLGNEIEARAAGRVRLISLLPEYQFYLAQA